MKGELSEESLDSLPIVALGAGSAKLTDRFEAMGGILSEKAVKSVIYDAVRSGSVDCMTWLESRGTAIAPHAQLALLHAVRRGNVAMVELLIKNGAPLEVSRASDETTFKWPLIIAKLRC